MSASEQYERRLALEGASNFRDLGGYVGEGGRRVRWRVLFRSDRLAGLTAADVEQLRALGIATVFDLRGAVELARHGPSALQEHGVAHVHVPFFPEVEGAVPPTEDAAVVRRGLRYLDIVEQARGAVRDVVTALADGGHYPAVFHCTGGKDRTGMLAALVLSALGVDDEVIAQDYALTSQYLTWTDAQLAAMASEYNIEITRDLLAAEPATILAMLRGLEERYGSVLGFLEDCGVSARHVAALQERLLER